MQNEPKPEAWHSSRWVIPVVGGGMTAVTLVQFLGFSPGTLEATLIAIVGMLVAARLLGFGHKRNV